MTLLPKMHHSRWETAMPIDIHVFGYCQTPRDSDALTDAWQRQKIDNIVLLCKPEMCCLGLCETKTRALTLTSCFLWTSCFVVGVFSHTAGFSVSLVMPSTGRIVFLISGGVYLFLIAVFHSHNLLSCFPDPSPPLTFCPSHTLSLHVSLSNLSDTRVSVGVTGRWVQTGGVVNPLMNVHVGQAGFSVCSESHSSLHLYHYADPPLFTLQRVETRGEDRQMKGWKELAGWQETEKKT